MNKVILVIIIGLGLISYSCFGLMPNDSVIYTDPVTGSQSQTWFYYPPSSGSETKNKLAQRILNSPLYNEDNTIEIGNISDSAIIAAYEALEKIRVEEIEKMLVKNIIESSLYKACIERSDIPKATYSEAFTSATLTCVSKKK